MMDVTAMQRSGECVLNTVHKLNVAAIIIVPSKLKLEEFVSGTGQRYVVLKFAVMMDVSIDLRRREFVLDTERKLNIIRAIIMGVTIGL